MAIWIHMQNSEENEAESLSKISLRFRDPETGRTLTDHDRELFKKWKNRFRRSKKGFTKHRLPYLQMLKSADPWPGEPGKGSRNPIPLEKPPTAFQLQLRGVWRKEH